MFMLDIYTWNAMEGIDPAIRSTIHETQDDAIVVVKKAPTFAYAVLSIYEDGQYLPCDWRGHKLIGSQNWPRICGENRHHPDVGVFRDDWNNLVGLVKSERAKNNRPLIEIAGEIIRLRHPSISGMTEKLAYAAA